MKAVKTLSLATAALAAALVIGSPAHAATGIQVGASGKTYASSGLQCGMNPVTGMAPFIQAGLYNPTQKTKGTISLNNTPIATVSFLSPDATVWLADGANTVAVTLSRKISDSYLFDAAPAGDQANVCIPDTSSNTAIGDLEYAASYKSYATVTPGCAWNSRTGQAQPFVNLFTNGSYLLNVSVNNVPLTQLNGTTRAHTPVFLSAGLNVIAAANGAVSTDYYVRDGGTGTCTLP